MEKTTLVLGASPNAARYSNAATWKLRHHGHKVIAFGPRNGDVLPDSRSTTNASLP